MEDTGEYSRTEPLPHGPHTPCHRATSRCCSPPGPSGCSATGCWRSSWSCTSTRRPRGRRDRAAAGADAPRRRGDPPVADDPRRPPRPAARPRRGRGPAPGRRASRSSRRPCSRCSLVAATDRRHQPQRQRGRPVPRGRAGVAHASSCPARGGRTSSPGTSSRARSRRPSGRSPAGAVVAAGRRDAGSRPARRVPGGDRRVRARRRRCSRSCSRASPRPSRSPRPRSST